MNKFLIVLFLIIGSFSSYSQAVMFGAAGSYGSSIYQVAPNFRLYYGATEQLCFGPEYTFYQRKIDESEKVTLDEIGFVVHYIFELKEKVGIYPVLGVNYSIEKEIEHAHLAHQKKAFGASIGAGMHLSIKNFMPFAEYKYITGALRQHTISAGLIYSLHVGSHSKH